MRVTIDLNVTKNRLSSMSVPVNRDVLYLDHGDVLQRLSECFDGFTFELLSHGFRLSPGNVRPGMQFDRQLNAVNTAK
jgi:hypothetical protein